MNKHNQVDSNDFTSVMLRLASPDRILDWSFGEITKVEIINY
jgi:DNA-directed RNA polymerase subunit beta'